MTFWIKSKDFCPAIVRCLARHPRGDALTAAEIAQRSGLSVELINAISQQTSWHGIDLPTMQKYLVGCGLDFENRRQMKRANAYRGRPITWRHLKRLPDWSSFWVPLIKKIAKEA